MKSKKLNTLLSFLVVATAAALAYDISGTTLSDIGKQLNSQGSGYASNTTVTFNLNVKTNTDTGKNCPDCKKKFASKITLSDAKITVSTSIDLPNWSDESSAPCQAIKTEWDRFLAAVKTHENGHVTRATDFEKNNVPGYETRINAVVGTGCSDVSQEDADQQATTAVQNAVKAIFDEMQKAMNDIQNKYDSDTNHGVTQGAGLDTSIKCP